MSYMPHMRAHSHAHTQTQLDFGWYFSILKFLRQLSAIWLAHQNNTILCKYIFKWEANSNEMTAAATVRLQTLQKLNISGVCVQANSLQFEFPFLPSLALR